MTSNKPVSGWTNHVNDSRYGADGGPLPRPYSRRSQHPPLTARNYNYSQQPPVPEQALAHPNRLIRDQYPYPYPYSDPYSEVARVAATVPAAAGLLCAQGTTSDMSDRRSSITSMMAGEYGGANGGNGTSVFSDNGSEIESVEGREVVDHSPLSSPSSSSSSSSTFTDVSGASSKKRATKRDKYSYEQSTKEQTGLLQRGAVYVKAGNVGWMNRVSYPQLVNAERENNALHADPGVNTGHDTGAEVVASTSTSAKRFVLLRTLTLSILLRDEDFPKEIGGGVKGLLLSYQLNGRTYQVRINLADIKSIGQNRPSKQAKSSNGGGGGGREHTHTRALSIKDKIESGCGDSGLDYVVALCMPEGSGNGTAATAAAATTTTAPSGPPSLVVLAAANARDPHSHTPLANIAHRSKKLVNVDLPYGRDGQPVEIHFIIYALPATGTAPADFKLNQLTSWCTHGQRKGECKERRACDERATEAFHIEVADEHGEIMMTEELRVMRTYDSIKRAQSRNRAATDTTAPSPPAAVSVAAKAAASAAVNAAAIAAAIRPSNEERRTMDSAVQTNAKRAKRKAESVAVDAGASKKPTRRPPPITIPPKNAPLPSLPTSSRSCMSSDGSEASNGMTDHDSHTNLNVVGTPTHAYGADIDQLLGMPAPSGTPPFPASPYSSISSDGSVSSTTSTTTCSQTTSTTDEEQASEGMIDHMHDSHTNLNAVSPRSLDNILIRDSIFLPDDATMHGAELGQQFLASPTNRNDAADAAAAAGDDDDDDDDDDLPLEALPGYCPFPTPSAIRCSTASSVPGLRSDGILAALSDNPNPNFSSQLPTDRDPSLEMDGLFFQAI